MTGSLSALGPGATFDYTLGAMLIGALFSMSLWGVTCTQTYDYFMNENNTDGRLQRSIVVLLWIRMIDTVSSVIHSHIAYFYLAASFANEGDGQKIIWSLNALAPVSGISNFIIRLMFARRIYQFGQGNIIVPTWIILMSICDLVCNMVTVVKGLIPVLVYISFTFGVVADLSVTIALSWLLQSAKSGFRRESDSIVNVLMSYTVNTGLLVTLFATAELITYVIMPRNFIFLAILILVSKLYVNAYLATLNVRRLRGTPTSEGIRLSRMAGSNSQGRGDAQGMVLSSDNEKRKSSTLAISCQKTVERRVDDSSELDEQKHSPHAV